MGQLDRIDMEGSGVGQLMKAMKKSVSPKEQTVYYGKVHKSSPIQVKLGHLQDLLTWEDLIILKHVDMSIGNKIILLPVDGGDKFVVLGNQ